jgi:hypothetical protein
VLVVRLQAWEGTKPSHRGDMRAYGAQGPTREGRRRGPVGRTDLHGHLRRSGQGSHTAPRSMALDPAVPHGASPRLSVHAQHPSGLA